MMTEKELAAYHDSWASLMRFSARYREDEALRARIENGDYGELQGPVPEGAEVRVVCQTPEVFYMLMPGDPGTAMSDQELGAIAGGSTFTTAGSALTSNCLGGTFSSQASIGTTVMLGS